MLRNLGCLHAQCKQAKSAAKKKKQAKSYILKHKSQPWFMCNFF